MHKSNCRGASPPLLHHGLHAIDATPARWRGGVPDSLIDLRTGQRCHGLRHQKKGGEATRARAGAADDALTPEAFETLIREEIRDRRGVVLLFVDFFDVEGSLACWKKLGALVGHRRRAVWKSTSELESGNGHNVVSMAWGARYLISTQAARVGGGEQVRSPAGRRFPATRAELGRKALCINQNFTARGSSPLDGARSIIGAPESLVDLCTGKALQGDRALLAGQPQGDGRATRELPLGPGYW